MSTSYTLLSCLVILPSRLSAFGYFSFLFFAYVGLHCSERGENTRPRFQLCRSSKQSYKYKKKRLHGWAHSVYISLQLRILQFNLVDFIHLMRSKEANSEARRFLVAKAASQTQKQGIDRCVCGKPTKLVLLRVHRMAGFQRVLRYSSLWANHTRWSSI